MKRGVLLIFATAIISGFSIFMNAFGVKGLNPFLFTGAKNLIVGIFLLSLLLLFKRGNSLRRLSFSDWKNLSLIGLIGGSIPFLLFFKGLIMATPAQGSFIHKTMVVWVAVLALLFLKEKLNWKVIVGAVLLLFGNFLALNLTGFDMSLGLGLIFIATLFWSAEIVYSKKILEKLSGNVVAFGRMFFGSLFIMIFLIYTGDINLVSGLGLNQISWILVTSLFLIGYVMTFYNGLKFVSASNAVAILSFGSVITTILNFVFLDKIVSLSQVFGFIAISIGVFLFVKNATKSDIHSITSTANA